MGALPKKKISKSRSRKRFSTKLVKSARLTKCPNCRKLKMPHKVCLNCGVYKGRQVLAQKEEVKITKVEENKK